MYMYPPTPALAMAGAAPGTTFGVDLGFFPIYAPTASIATAFRLLSLQTLRGTTSIVPLRNCPAPRLGPTEPLLYRSESAGHTPPWAPPNPPNPPQQRVWPWYTWELQCMEVFADLGFRENFQISLFKTAFGGIPSLETNFCGIDCWMFAPIESKKMSADFGAIARNFGGITRTQLWLQISTAHENPITAELKIVGIFFVCGRNFRIRRFQCWNVISAEVRKRIP